MTDLNKTPMKAPDYRYFWWLDYTEFLKKTASNLEDVLEDEFRFNQFNEQPDNEASAVNLILNGLQALIMVAQKQTDKNKINLAQFEDFCEYWVHGRGEWNGLQEFLRKEAN